MIFHGDRPPSSPRTGRFSGWQFLISLSLLIFILIPQHRDQDEDEEGEGESEKIPRIRSKA